ncbi:MAG: prolipoprotein diacylglyceryl transferase [Polyangia bacterium]|jgi:phosphatidylglycerol:prolipoprotein diacylglycerol transferase
MLPILVQIPAKPLFVLALVLALASAILGAAKRRPGKPRSSTTLYLLIGAWLVLGLRGHSWIPSGAMFSRSWLPVPIFSYGVMLGTAMVVGWFLAMRLARQDGIGSEQAGAIYMWTAIWSIVGARLLYVITEWQEFTNPLDIILLNKGGLVAYGGMIGGFLASWYGCHKRKIELLRWADVSAPSVVLGTAITRIGCLLFGCDFGRRSELPWAIRFPREAPAWQDHVANFGLDKHAPWSFPVHPTQIYESLAGLALFGLLMYLRRVRKFSGEVFLAWVLGYGTLRPIIEVYRGDSDRGSVGPLSTSQFIGISSVVLGLVLLATLLRKSKLDPEGARLWERPVSVAEVAGHRTRSRPGTKSRRAGRFDV